MASTPNGNAAASVAVVVASNNWRKRTRNTVLSNHRIALVGSIVLCIALWNMRIASLMGASSSSMSIAAVGGGEVNDAMNAAKTRTNAAASSRRTDMTFTRRTIPTPENVTGASIVSSSSPLFYHVSPGSTGSRNLYFAT
jgi:hypothetical protein